MLLDIFKENFSDNQRVQNLIKYFYRKYREGFYVNAESRIIMHIPPKYFKMTIRYGLYRRGYNKRLKK